MRKLVWIVMLALVACITVKQAHDVFCRLKCLDEGEYGGDWNDKEQACECKFLVYPSLKINGFLLNHEDK